MPHVCIQLLTVRSVACRTTLCRFSGLRIYPGRGVLFVQRDGTVRPRSGLEECHVMHALMLRMCARAFFRAGSEHAEAVLALLQQLKWQAEARLN